MSFAILTLSHNFWSTDFGLVSLSNDVSTFLGNLMPKPSLLYNGSGTSQSIAGG